MAKDDKVKEQKQKARFAAMEGLKPSSSFPIPPRKAMGLAKKSSKGLSYPLAPYPHANLLKMYRWGEFEWRKLGRWQMLALPFIIIVALRTWEKEIAIQEEGQAKVERNAAKQEAADIYGAFGKRTKKRKLFGLIPLPGRK